MLVRHLHQLSWCNRFAHLPAAFYTRVTAQPVRAPQLLHGNADVAAWLGLDPDALHQPDVVAQLAGNQPIPGSDPLAAVYSGHQFGVWAGQLGDGRALLLGGVRGPAGEFELQLKGAGLTPYSRMGDGRAVLRSSVREYLASLAMHGLGIPTTHALALVGAADTVQRETLETAAIVTRVAPSFVRFGSFQHWAAQHDRAALQSLLDHVIDGFYPQCRLAGPDNDAVVPAFLQIVLERTAQLMAAWQAVGFMHGVMNTDNMSILGLTLDYGPYGFMDGFNAHHICNHTDSAGRYAWNVQPAVAHWNLVRLAEALRPLVSHANDLRAVLEHYEAEFTQAFRRAMHAKLGLEHDQSGDDDLLDALWQLLHDQRADFPLAFRRLAWIDTDPLAPHPDAAEVAGGNRGHFLDLFHDVAAAQVWRQRYLARLAHETRSASARRSAMLATNPLYVLRNHLAELAIRDTRDGNLQTLARLADVLRQPFTPQAHAADLAALPPDWARTLEVSCSS